MARVQLFGYSVDGLNGYFKNADLLKKKVSIYFNSKHLRTKINIFKNSHQTDKRKQQFKTMFSIYTIN